MRGEGLEVRAEWIDRDRASTVVINGAFQVSFICSPRFSTERIIFATFDQRNKDKK